MKAFRRALLGVLLLSTPAIAGPGGKGKGGPAHFNKMAEELGLTAEQKDKMKELHKQGREENKAKREALKEQRKALGEILANPASTPEQLNAANEKMIESRSEMMRVQFGKMLQMRSLLTPEQLKKFGDMKPLEKGRGPRGDGPDDEDF